MKLNFDSRANTLLIVPPFAGIDRPSLGVHLLQGCAREAGFAVAVLYANILFAAELGEKKYCGICYGSTTDLTGEQIFSPCGFEGNVPVETGAASHFKRSCQAELHFEQTELTALQLIAAEWVESLATSLADRGFTTVGCTTTFEQTAASIAILKKIKEKAPTTVTILGGANAEGDMASGLLSLNTSVDYIFSGESEKSFPTFLGTPRTQEQVANKIVWGEPCTDMDSLPTPKFSEYYEQLTEFLPQSRVAATNNIWLPYESSRGCWWGEKHHCTFCGINGQMMSFRHKSPGRVLSDLKQLTETHPSNKVCMVDNIMPHEFFQTLLPRLGEEIPSLHIFYEQKANLTLEKVITLKNSGVAIIQPGIESLSSSLLRKMDKGVSAKQNLALLRYARSVDLSVNWNLLYGFPGDEAREYEEILKVLPLLHHLQPPTGLFHLSIDRFSPYFKFPEKFGITNIQPIRAYASVFPSHADIGRIAYHFMGEYKSGAHEHPELICQISEELDTWRAHWETAAPPTLGITCLSDEHYLLIDTRGLPGTQELNFLSQAEAALILRGCRSEEKLKVGWALERFLLVELDDRCVPLVTADPTILRQFEQPSSPRATITSKGLEALSSRVDVALAG